MDRVPLKTDPGLVPRQALKGQRGQQGQAAPADQVVPAGGVAVGHQPPLKPPHPSTPAQTRAPQTLVQDQTQSESKKVWREFVELSRCLTGSPRKMLHLFPFI